MRVLIQRVSEASVRVSGTVIGSIGTGLLVLVGVEEADTLEDAEWLAGKISRIRLFADAEQKMNADLAAVNGRLLVVSQFTLHASTRKGNRPSFIKAARPEHARHLYETLVRLLEKETNTPVETGEFGADMKISLVNDGPVTIWIDSRDRE